MNRLLSCHLLWLLLSLQSSVYAFGNAGRSCFGIVSNRLASNVKQTQSQLSTTVDARRMGELTEPEQQVFDIMDAIHLSEYKFRMIVVGKGAILETTAALGPVLKVTQSPSTGTNMLTLANEDQSFEFHLQLAQVSKIVLLEKETPAKTLRLVRILNAAGESMSSLILADESQEAVTWFEQGLIATFGTEIQL